LFVLDFERPLHFVSDCPGMLGKNRGEVAGFGNRPLVFLVA
jgi:hypothetical protein